MVEEITCGQQLEIGEKQRQAQEEIMESGVDTKIFLISERRCTTEIGFLISQKYGIQYKDIPLLDFPLLNSAKATPPISVVHARGNPEGQVMLSNAVSTPSAATSSKVPDLCTNGRIWPRCIFIHKTAHVFVRPILLL